MSNEKDYADMYKAIVDHKYYGPDMATKEDETIKIEEISVSATISFNDLKRIPDIKIHLEKYHKFLPNVPYDWVYDYNRNEVCYTQTQRRLVESKPKAEPDAELEFKRKFIESHRRNRGMLPLDSNASDELIHGEYHLAMLELEKDYDDKTDTNKKAKKKAENSLPPEEPRQPLDLFSLKDLEES